MDFLKDKKNLPIVVGVAVAFLVGAAGLIAWELGLLSGGGSPTPVPAQLAHRGGPTPGGPAGPDSVPPPAAPNAPPPSAPPPPQMARMMAGHGMTAPNAAPAAAPNAAPAPVAVVDPTRGPDPFGIPGGTKRIASRNGPGGGTLKGMKTPLRNILPVFNLFKVQAPEPPPALVLPVTGPALGSAPPANVVLDGIVSAADGIYALLEINGQSQQVKPGDSLQDGSRVTSIQATSVTLRSAAGVTSTVALTGGGGGQADPNGNGTDPNAGGQFGQPFGQP